MPTDRARLSLVLTNRSEEEIVVRTELNGARERGNRARGSAGDGVDRARLMPHEMRVLDLSAAAQLRDGVGGLTIDHEGPTGAVMARVLILDSRVGYSASLPFSDPAGAKTTTHHGGGFRMVNGSAATRPVVVARNVGSTRTTVGGRLTISIRDSSPEVIVLPGTSLEPGESALLDYRQAWRRATTFTGVTGVGAVFEYASSPGSVVMSAATVSVDLNHYFQVPLIDPETPPSSTGGYPWRADETGTTVVYLKNTTDAPQQYALQLTSAASGYAPGLKTLPAGETVAIDVRQLRDEQVPDAFGRTIPTGTTGGQVHWSAKGREQYAIVGRAEFVDLAHGVSATYACLNCCPDHPYA